MTLTALNVTFSVGAVAVFLFEFRDRQFRQSWYRDGRRVRRNLGFGAASVLVMVVLKSVNGSLEGLFPVTMIDGGSASGLEVPACFLLAELTGWLLHYVKHKNGFLWKFHFQHHRENEYNLWLTTHTHGLEVIVSGLIMAAVLLIARFSVLTIELYLVYYGFMKTFQHSARSYSFGPLDRVFITPGYHRLHHEVNSAWNYGITLTVFDVLFRTAKWPNVASPATAAVYGVSSNEAMPFGFWSEITFFITGGHRTSSLGATLRTNTGDGHDDQTRQIDQA